MFLGLFLTCVVALAIATVLLLLLGHRLRFASRILGILCAVALALGAGEVAALLWDIPAATVVAAEVLLVTLGVIVVLARSPWNPIGQVFYGTLLASVCTYLSFAAWYTVLGGLSPIAIAASAALFVLELLALLLTGWYAFDSIDASCRVRWTRSVPDPDPGYRPKVSLQIAAYNEPPDMLIDTIGSVEGIDYPNLEVLVIDNNTQDPETWRPVEEYCRDRDRVTFVHVDRWPGYKAGALNHLLTEYTAPDAELVGVIDADYLVDPGYLNDVVGYFADANLAFLQTPQDYREFEGDPYLTACYDAGEYFFRTTMPSRNERNSIIFAGTMGLIRRSVLDELDGWDEWCITEDAQTSLRILKRGYSGLYLGRSFGKGIMPLTFGALKSQRFRWCFGGVQILRRHWRDLIPGRRTARNRLTIAQRLDYLFGSLHWFNDLVYLGFTTVLLGSAALLLLEGRIGIRPLLGAVVLLPTVLIGSGFLRAVWALRNRTGIGLKRAVLAFVNWLSLSWTVAFACLQGLFRKEGVFLRTPKSGDEPGLGSAVWAARSETVMAVSLWAAGIAVGVRGLATPFLLFLFGWQGSVYASSTFMSVLNQRMKLSDQLERRRRTERMRDRLSQRWPYYLGGLASIAAVAAAAALILFGGANPGNPKDPFEVPRGTSGRGPLASLLGPRTGSEPTPTTSPSPTTPGSVTPSPTASPTPTVSPTESPSPSPTTSPAASP
jgi:cellulose synthase/poly-beta-1,6-N-acetylglucosamine synthase-like glycosyltransferase